MCLGNKTHISKTSYFFKNLCISSSVCLFKNSPFVVCSSHLCLIIKIQVVNFVHSIMGRDRKEDFLIFGIDCDRHKEALNSLFQSPLLKQRG